VETLAATLEEVDFLASLGLHSDAMDVLKAYLEDSASPAPVAFFELMRVCGLADDPQAVEAVRRRYAKVFGRPAPRLEQVTDPAGLEAQPALNARVIACWGGGGVLPVIEQALFDTPASESPLTLQTARDLISLYDVAMLLATEDQAAAGRGQQDQALAPWAHAEHAHEAQAVAQAVADDFSGHRFALDIDLSVVPQAQPEKPSQPDAQEVAARLLAEKEAARHHAAARAAAEAEDAFSAAVAFERAPISRF
jgi:pilus assembly protein FimV